MNKRPISDAVPLQLDVEPLNGRAGPCSTSRIVHTTASCRAQSVQSRENILCAARQNSERSPSPSLCPRSHYSASSTSSNCRFVNGANVADLDALKQSISAENAEGETAVAQGVGSTKRNARSPMGRNRRSAE